MTPKKIKQDLNYILSKMKNIQERPLEIEKHSEVEEFEEVETEIKELPNDIQIAIEKIEKILEKS